jgi:hypothetical protein
MEVDEPRLTPPRRWKLGITISRFVPIFDISFRIFCFEPSPMASMAITEATPMIIPSIVKTALRRFLTNARMAIINKFE